MTITCTHLCQSPSIILSYLFAPLTAIIPLVTLSDRLVCTLAAPSGTVIQVQICCFRFIRSHSDGSSRVTCPVCYICEYRNTLDLSAFIVVCSSKWLNLPITGAMPAVGLEWLVFSYTRIQIQKWGRCASSPNNLVGLCVSKST